MIKRSASRTQRSKGFVRAKQILQILLLLGICFWLVYQLKYSHDKKKAILDDKDSEISNKEQDGRKSGRKELLPRVYDKQHNVAEEDEDKVEDEHQEVEEINDQQLEDDLKKAHEDVELEEEEEIVKNDEPENQEKPGEVEVEEEEGEDHEEFIDEEKAKEEEPKNEGNGEEVKNKQVDDDDDDDDDQDRDEISREAHEAREEHYKGDDASSAVTHDTEIDAVEIKELDKSSVHNNDSTVEITEDSSGSESSNGSEDHDNATELANSSPTDETELGNAAAVNSAAIVEASTDQPELIESSSNHSEDTSLVGSDSNLRLPSHTTESSVTN